MKGLRCGGNEHYATIYASKGSGCIVGENIVEWHLISFFTTQPCRVCSLINSTGRLCTPNCPMVSAMELFYNELGLAGVKRV